MEIRKAERAVALRTARARNPELFDRLMAGASTHRPMPCWNWTGHKVRGYGRLKVGGRATPAHRVSHELFYGFTGPEVRHLCHNPACINPLHLRPGTHAQNMQDRKDAGRGGDLRGEANGRAKLTDAAVRSIRASAATTAELVALHGVSKVTICAIRRGAKWKHIN